MSATVKVWVDGSAPNCAAADLNGFKNENNNSIVASGQATDTGDNTQTGRAMTIHAAGSDYYTDSGAANAYVATIAASGVAFYPIPSAVGYFTGMRVRIVPANTNTSTSTINVSSLGAKNIYNNGAALIGGELQAGYEATLVYNGTEFDITSVERNVLLAGSSYDGVVSVTTTPYNVLAANAGKLHTLSSSAAALTMCAIAGVTDGATFRFVNYLSTNCTIARDGSSTFNGTNTYNSTTTSITVPPYSAVIIVRSSSSTWEVTGIAGGQDQRVLSAGDFTVAANLSFVLSTLDPTQHANNMYRLVMKGFQPVSDDKELYGLLSSDGGSTYAVTTYDSAIVGLGASDDASGTGRARSQKSEAQAIVLGAQTANESLSNTSGSTACVVLQIHNMNTGTVRRPHILIEGDYYAASTDLTRMGGVMSNNTAADYDAIRFTWESGGNFAAVGNYVLYKMMRPV